MVHSVLIKEDKKQYAEGFNDGFLEHDMKFFKGEYYNKGWDVGVFHREVLEKKELKSLQKKLIKKHKRLS